MVEPEKYKYSYFDLKKSTSVTATTTLASVEPIALAKADSTCGSQWNSCGTWEEKAIEIAKLKEYINKCIKELVKGFKTIEITDLSGEATIVFSRKKRKIGYELSATISMEIEDGTKVSAKIENMCDYCPDDISVWL